MRIERSGDETPDQDFDALGQNEKEGFLETLDEFKKQISGKEEMKPSTVDFLFTIFVFTSRRGYQSISELEFQRFLAAQFNLPVLGTFAFEYVMGVFKHMADCVVEGIDEFVLKISKPNETEIDRITRSVAILFRLNRYLSEKEGESNPDFMKTALVLIAMIEKSAEGKSFTASHFD